MTTPLTPHRASINPEDFKSDREQMLTMTCNQVVDFKVEDEAKRNAHTMPDSESESRIGFKTVPPSLIPALDALATMKARSRNLITKCLAHQGVLLLVNLPGIKELNTKHDEIILLNGRTGILTDLILQMDIPQYHFVSAHRLSGAFTAAQRLLGECAGLSSGLAIGSSTLFLVCLAWALTTTDDPDLKGLADRELEPEVRFFKRYVRERAKLVNTFWEIAQDRVAERQNNSGNILSEKV